MDPAQQMELHAQRYHKTMDDLIDRGDSPVQQFYSGTTVFVTGGSGFLGKQLIEKLFRSCAINKMYLLTRPKKGYTLKERLDHMLKDPVFDRTREKQPQFADKIVAIEGDVADIRLGLSDNDWTMLTKEVNIIFHEAAIINLNETLRKAVLTNVRGTREIMTLAKHCDKLKQFVQVSTAFCHATNDRINTDVSEQFYPCPVPPHVMISLAEDVDQSRLDSITKDLTQGWANTYTFTKATAEELIRTSAGDTPVCVVRPSIVLPALFEPNPGWLDTHTVIGPSGLYLGGGVGVTRVFFTGEHDTMTVAPVDYVNNATIAAAWDSTERKNNGDTNIPVYNIGRDLKVGLLYNTATKQKATISSPKCIWYTNVMLINSKILYFFLSWFYHFIPAYLMDFVFKVIGKEMPKGLPSFVQTYKLIDKLFDKYNYFIMNDWNFKDNNIRSMVERMNEADKVIFNCDLSNIDMKEYIVVWFIGLRRYILKDELKGTTAAYKKQQILRIVHYIVMAIYLYILWFIFVTIFVFVKNLFMCLF